MASRLFYFLGAWRPKKDLHHYSYVFSLAKSPKTDQFNLSKICRKSIPDDQVVTKCLKTSSSSTARFTLPKVIKRQTTTSQWSILLSLSFFVELQESLISGVIGNQCKDLSPSNKCLQYFPTKQNENVRKVCFLSLHSFFAILFWRLRI